MCTTTTEVLQWAISHPPTFEFKYSELTLFFYLNVMDVNKTSSFLLQHYHDISMIESAIMNNDFNELFCCELEIYVETNIRQLFLKDITTLLIQLVNHVFLLDDEFVSTLNENNHLQMSVEDGREHLKDLMETKVKYMQFKRTAQTCTPFGFI
jgi:hypothetical protein